MLVLWRGPARWTFRRLEAADIVVVSPLDLATPPLLLEPRQVLSIVATSLRQRALCLAELMRVTGPRRPLSFCNQSRTGQIEGMLFSTFLLILEREVAK